MKNGNVLTFIQQFIKNVTLHMLAIIFILTDIDTHGVLKN